MVLLREGMCPGLDQDLVRRLRDVHVKTVEDYVSSDIEDLARKCSASYTALMAIRRVLLAQHAAFPVSGADLYDELLSSSAILATGNPDLDTLLDSGVYTGEITELAGGPGSGKTQMEALQRITVYRAFDVFSLLDCLYRLSANGGRLRQACGSCVKALIVDSVSAVIAPLLGSKYQEGMLMMNQVAISLKTMAKDFNLATLVTNHVTQNDEGEVQPGLGVSWSHVPRTRVLLERLPDADRPTLRSVTLVKSSRQPCLLRAELDLQWWSHSDSEASRKTELDRGNS
ncbi:DNA repair protein RAD51 homolog 4 isoform X2 [Corythoichthys intestinalis]|uniref:DNA repair protein RAD51 homolog 4 isoform X2 n=1 Tax=Corythoichthys intestinalis TaxID=161448 RepID=UPI0025A4D454|nr:DNA repair protein RAD51 homolog 4 isoform X2 [Corythoichthys intestinalis]